MRINIVETGMLAKSKAGHDKGQVYVIYGLDETYVYLVDGKIRTIEKPKKKKKDSKKKEKDWKMKKEKSR